MIHISLLLDLRQPLIAWLIFYHWSFTAYLYRASLFLCKFKIHEKKSQKSFETMYEIAIKVVSWRRILLEVQHVYGTISKHNFVVIDDACIAVLQISTCLPKVHVVLHHKLINHCVEDSGMQVIKILILFNHKNKILNKIISVEIMLPSVQ